MSEIDANGISYRQTGSVGYKMKSTSGWRENGNGDNSSGFKVLPGGNCSKFGGFLLGEGAYFWSSTPNDESRVWSRQVRRWV